MGRPAIKIPSSPPPSNTTPIQPLPQTFPPHPQAKLPPLEMDLENWETIPMLGPELVQPCAPQLRVFFPPNDDISSPNTILDRSAVVLLGPGAATVNQLHRRITSVIANTFGCHTEEFKISPLNPETGDLLLEFPSKVLRNIAVHVGVYTVARGVDIQLRAWTTSINMARDPTTHKARITIHGLPMQYWNFIGVSRLICGFGYPEIMRPVITNCNFESLKVLI